MELNAVVWESDANMVAPVFELGPRPLKFVIIVPVLERLEVEEHVKFSIGRGQHGDFWTNYSEDVERNFFEDIGKNMFNSTRRKCRVLLKSWHGMVDSQLYCDDSIDVSEVGVGNCNISLPNIDFQLSLSFVEVITQQWVHSRLEPID